MSGLSAALAPLVRGRRWFASKSRELAGGRIVDSGALSSGCTLALFEAAFADGGSELYQVPYRVDAGGAPVLELADPVLAGALLAALRDSARVVTGSGELVFEAAAPLPPIAELGPVRPIGGEQSNSTVVFGEHLALKAYRRLEDGESAELEMLRFLAAHGFEHAPRLLGSYRYVGAPVTATLGILQEFVPDGRDGWADALASLADPEPFLPRLHRLGQVTARMHAVLASGDSPAFRPRGDDPAVRSDGDGVRHRRGAGGGWDPRDAVDAERCVERAVGSVAREGEVDARGSGENQPSWPRSFMAIGKIPLPYALINNSVVSFIPGRVPFTGPQTDAGPA